MHVHYGRRDSDQRECGQRTARLGPIEQLHAAE